MKAIKRTVAALLATLMLATSTSFTLAAETYTNSEAVVVAKVNAAGIMQGTDKGFEPSKSLTRAEAAAIIVRMKGISESAVKSMAGTTLFNDVAASHWASGYVNEASNLGIVKGVSATEFAPDREVTVAEFTTMAVRALGAGTMVDAQGTWPTNYVNFANEEGLLDDVTAVYTSVASRMNAATIVANTLEAPMWVKTKATTSSEVTWEKSTRTVDGTEYDRTLLSEVLNISVIEDASLYDIETKDSTVTMIVGSKDTTPLAARDKEDIAFDVNEKVALATVKTGLIYDMWYNTKDKEIVGIWDSEDSKLTKITFEDVDDVDGTEVTFVIDGKKVTYKEKTAAGTLVSINNVSTSKVIADLEDSNYAVSGYAYLDANKLVNVYAEKFTKYGVVESVNDTRIKFNTKFNGTVSSISIDTDHNEYVVTKNGAAIDVEDIEKDDVVFYYDESITGGRKYTMNVYTDKVEGKIKSANNSADYVTIGGEKVYYTVADTDMKSGNEIVAYKNTAGKIVLYDVVEGVSGDYAVISDIKVSPATEVGKDNKLNVRLATLDGTIGDWMEVDLTECYAETNPFIKKDATKVYINGDTTGVAFATDGIAKTIGDNLVKGSLVKYTTKSGKVVFTNIKNNDSTPALNIIELKDHSTDHSTFKVNSKTSSYVTDANDSDKKYYLTSSTKIVKVKAANVSNRTIAKVELLDLEDLDSSSDVEGFIADIDYDEKEIGVLVLTSGINRVSEADFALVLSIDAQYEDEDDEDVSVLYNVVYADGTQKELLADNEITATGLFVGTVAEGNVYEFTFDEGKVTAADTPNTYSDDMTAAGTFLGANKHFIGKEYSDGISFADYDDTTNAGLFGLEDIRYAVSENVLVIKHKSSEYKVSNYSAIKLLDNITYPNATSGETAKLAQNVSDFNNAEATEIESYVTYDDGDGVEIIAIIIK